MHVGSDLMNLQGLCQVFKTFSLPFSLLRNLSILKTSLYIVNLTCNYCYNKVMY